LTDSSPLVTIVVAVGLAVLSTHDFTGGAGRNGKPTERQTPSSVLALQLFGFSILAAALYVAAPSFERGHRLGLQDLKVENIFIATLVMINVFLLARYAWGKFAPSSPEAPWERGLIDQFGALISFVIALLVTALVTIGVVEYLLATSIEVKGATTLFVVAAILIVGLGVTTATLRLLVGGDPTPRGFARSRRQQQRLLQALDGVDGSWKTLRIKAAGVLEPALSMTATVLMTKSGWYWRSEDGGMLARYHKWAANHARLPTRELHSHAVTVFGGIVFRSRRGMRITPITRRWWWIDAWRSHRDQAAPAADESAPEYEAGLVFISPSELQAAGLVVWVEDGVS
jgi:hypothetical protein